LFVGIKKKNSSSIFKKRIVVGELEQLDLTDQTEDLLECLDLRPELGLNAQMQHGC
jgi:hypothetical protein